MSTPTTLAAQRARLDARGLSTATLRVLRDVDHYDDALTAARRGSVVAVRARACRRRRQSRRDARVSAPGLLLRSATGDVVSGHRWTGAADDVDDSVLRRCRAPVLDVGCGPGRHVLALAERGVPALGIDLTPHVVNHAQRSGALVLERCVFDHVPGTGRWGTVLLLDGNVGIGADPAELLRRVAALVSGRRRRSSSRSGSPVGEWGPTHARLEHDDVAGPWFSWCGVDASAVAAHGVSAGLRLHDEWSTGGREFLELRPRAGPWR